MLDNGFHLSHEEDGTTSSLVVTGELDLASAPRFRSLVRELLGAGVRSIHVDLSDTQFVDSSGLGALLWAEHRLRAIGGELTVANVHGPVERSFALAGMNGLLLH